MKSRLSARSQLALTLVEVLVVLAGLGVLALVLFSAFPRHHSVAMRITCARNLNQIGLSFRIWAEDDAGKGNNTGKYPMRVPAAYGGTMEQVASGVVWPHFQVMSNELNTPQVLVCPEDRPRMELTGPFVPRVVGGFSFKTNCPTSYFVGVDAEESKPTMLLAGDDNLAVNGKPVASGLLNLWTNSAVGWHKPRHQKGGNICFADASVQQINSKQLREALARTGVATNRLAMP